MEIDGRLREDAAVERGDHFEVYMGLHQKDSLEVRVGSYIDVSGHLPEDVGGHGAAAENDTSSAPHDDITSCLKDEYVGGGPADGDAADNQDAGSPPVHASRKGLAGDEAGHAVEVRQRGRTRRRVGVSRLHIEDGGPKHGRRWWRVVGRVAFARHLIRRGVCVVG